MDSNPKPSPPFQIRITDILILFVFLGIHLGLWAGPKETDLTIGIVVSISLFWFLIVFERRQLLSEARNRPFYLCLCMFFATLPLNAVFAMLHDIHLREALWKR